MISMLTGCATLSSDAAMGDESVRLLVARSDAALRAMVIGLADPAGDGAIGTALAGIDAARFAVATRAAINIDEPGIAGKAELVATGVALRVCRDGVERISGKLGDRAAALAYARGAFAVTCLGPLGVMAVR